MTTELHSIHAHFDGVFNAASGTLINIYKPEPEMIKVSDVAAALSKICRFGGHSKYFYSVAQHSRLVAKLCPDDCKIEGLMHDAAEAYLGDVIKPLKVILGKSYTDIEARFEDVIFDRFGLDRSKMREVKRWDMSALDIEFEYLVKGNHASWVKEMSQLNHQIGLQTPAEAERSFIKDYNTFVKPLGRMYSPVDVSLSSN